MAKLELNDILNSKIYVKDGGGMQFQSPKAYIEPFLEKVHKLNPQFVVETSGMVTNQNDDKTVNQAYARVKIEAKLPSEFNVEEHDSVIGLVYGLDTQKPVMKIYSGRNAWSCTNLAIFNAEHLHQVELLQGIGSVYEKTAVFSNYIADHIQQFQTRVRSMKQKEYDLSNIDNVIGALIRKALSNKTVGTTPIISAAQALYSKDSVYSIRDGKTSEWNIYSAITQYITDKTDVVDKATKTLYVSNMFEQLKA